MAPGPLHAPTAPRAPRGCHAAGWVPPYITGLGRRWPMLGAGAAGGCSTGCWWPGSNGPLQGAGLLLTPSCPRGPDHRKSRSCRGDNGARSHPAPPHSLTAASPAVGRGAAAAERRKHRGPLQSSRLRSPGLCCAEQQTCLCKKKKKVCLHGMTATMSPPPWCRGWGQLHVAPLCPLTPSLQREHDIPEDRHYRKVGSPGRGSSGFWVLQSPSLMAGAQQETMWVPAGCKLQSCSLENVLPKKPPCAFPPCTVLQYQTSSKPEEAITANRNTRPPKRK